jgi:hypothetical protein
MPTTTALGGRNADARPATGRHLVVIAPYPGVCRCDGARDGLNSRTTHYSDDPACKNNPDNTTKQGETT